MKASSRRPAMASPISSSTAPSPYISAVSISVSPRSRPSRRVAISSLRRLRSAAICQVPWPRAGTRSPEGRVTVFTICTPLVFLRQGRSSRRQPEPCAEAAQRRLQQGQVAAVAAGDVAGDGEAEAGAAGLRVARGLEAEEGAEHVLAPLRRD